MPEIAKAEHPPVYGWVSYNKGPWTPCTREGWVDAERRAGFNAPVGIPATNGFSGVDWTTHEPIRGTIFRPAVATVEDWTTKDGAANSSADFQRLAGAVEQIIRESAHSLIAGQVGDVAGLIVAQLAHRHEMAPIRLWLNRLDEMQQEIDRLQEVIDSQEASP